VSTGIVVCDASALVAVLVDSGVAGEWATERLADVALAAPNLAPFDVANILRRHEMAGHISADQAAQAHADLIDLTVDLWPYDLLAGRAWQLRHNVSIYDGAYVALAERLGATLVTLDRRLKQAPGVACHVAAPPAQSGSPTSS